MHQKSRDLHRRLRDPAMTALLVLETAIIFVISRLRAAGIAPPVMVITPLVLLVIIAVVALSRTPRAVLLIFVSMALNLTAAVIHAVSPSPYTIALRAAGELLARGVLGWVVAGAVFAPGRITHYRVQGAVVLYLDVAMMFGALYRVLAELCPGAFLHLTTGPNDPGFFAATTYFSLSALTSATFGDIMPIHPFARSLANLEGIIGQLYPTVLLARVVTLELAHRRSRNRRTSNQASRFGMLVDLAHGDGSWTTQEKRPDADETMLVGPHR